MSKFEFFGVNRIIFGRGQIRMIGELAAALARSVMIIHNGPDLPDSVMQGLSAAGVKATSHRQRGEPVVTDVDAAVGDARRHECDAVIGFGGGSAIDAAKAVAALLTNGGSAVDYMEVVGKGLRITCPAAPWIAIPTTAGTGAEATRNAVIGLPEKQFKASIRSELMLPRVALVDPELGLGVPPHVTASSGMDALCQLIESYTSIGATPMTDALATTGIPLAAGTLLKAYRDGCDLEARENMAHAALLSGITLTNAGLGAVHGFAAPLGANYPIPHGTICAALLPHVIRENIATIRLDPDGHRGLSRYATVGRLLMNDERLSEDDAIAACIHVTSELAREMQIPPLSRFGLKPADVPQMVALARKSSSTRFNPVVLSDQAMASALMAALG
jgi:alcohol dehydrogenase class IV